MLKIEFTDKGTKDFKKLPKDLQKRLLKKLEFFASQENPVLLSKPLVNLPPATHRFKIRPQLGEMLPLKI